MGKTVSKMDGAEKQHLVEELLRQHTEVIFNLPSVL